MWRSQTPPKRICTSRRCTHSYSSIMLWSIIRTTYKKWSRSYWPRWAKYFIIIKVLAQWRNSRKLSLNWIVFRYLMSRSRARIKRMQRNLELSILIGNLSLNSQCPNVILMGLTCGYLNPRIWIVGVESMCSEIYPLCRSWSSSTALAKRLIIMTVRRKRRKRKNRTKCMMKKPNRCRKLLMMIWLQTIIKWLLRAQVIWSRRQRLKNGRAPTRKFKKVRLKSPSVIKIK